MSEAARKSKIESMKIEWEAGWNTIKEFLSKIEKVLEGSEDKITANELMEHYSLIYNMCCQCPSSYVHCKPLYEGCKWYVDKYINSTVIPSLGNKTDEVFLRELLKRWRNHKVMCKWLDFIFGYLNNYYEVRSNVLSLKKSLLHTFGDLVFGKFKYEATEAVSTLVSRDYRGEPIDKDLLKEIAEMCGELDVDCFEKDLNMRMQMLSLMEKHQNGL